jgi:hypothetical protein
MSADNYVMVRKFGGNDYRWAMGFASDDYELTDKDFTHGPFPTPRAAADDAIQDCVIIEYGISFGSGCLKGDKPVDETYQSENTIGTENK